MTVHATAAPPTLAVNEVMNVGSVGIGSVVEDTTPRLWGVPLKYISYVSSHFVAMCVISLMFFLHRLVTLAVQNAALAIIMHYSRISTPPSRTYSAGTAVLMNELLKGSISLGIAFSRIDEYGPQLQQRRGPLHTQTNSWYHPRIFLSRSRRLGKEIFSSDCWKLSIPAILYGAYIFLPILLEDTCSRRPPQSSKIIYSSLPLRTLKRRHSR